MVNPTHFDLQSLRVFVLVAEFRMGAWCAFTADRIIDTYSRMLYQWESRRAAPDATR